MLCWPTSFNICSLHFLFCATVGFCWSRPTQKRCRKGAEKTVCPFAFGREKDARVSCAHEAFSQPGQKWCEARLRRRATEREGDGMEKIEAKRMSAMKNVAATIKMSAIVIISWRKIIFCAPSSNKTQSIHNNNISSRPTRQEATRSEGRLSMLLAARAVIMRRRAKMSKLNHNKH